MATYIATTAFIPTFLDDNGDPLNGGTLESYVANTTTPTPTFTGEAGVSAGDIITLNARGEPQTSGNTHQVWIDSAIKYDFVLKTAAGVIINSPEDVSYLAAGSVASVLNIAAAKALAILEDTQAVYIRGYTTEGDGGGGMYVYDASSAATANDGTVLALDTLAGRLLHNETTTVTVETFGAVGDGTAIENVAFQAAANSGIKQIKALNSYALSSSITVPLGVSFEFGGRDSTIYPVSGGTFINNFIFLFNTLDGATPVVNFPNLVCGGLSNVTFDNEAEKLTVKAVAAIGSYEFKDIRGRYMHGSIKRLSGYYSDNFKVSRVYGEPVMGTDYQIDLAGLGDCAVIEECHFPFNALNPAGSVNAYAMGNVLAGKISDCVGGNIKISGGSTASIKDCHLEKTQTLIQDSNVFIEDTFYGKGDDVPVVCESSGLQGHKLSLKNVELAFLEGVYEGTTADLKISNRYSVSIDNCYRRYTVNGSLDKSQLAGISIIKGDDSPITDFNDYSYQLSANSLIHPNYSVALDFTYASPSVSFDGISNAAADASTSWDDPTDTYFYSSQLIVDDGRLIGRNQVNAEASIALTSGGSGARLDLSYGSRTPSGIVRLYRGIATDSYTEYVDIPMISGSRFYDNGTTVNGFTWIARAAASKETLNALGSTSVTFKGTNVEIYSSSPPTIGTYVAADRFYRIAPVSAGYIGQVYDGASWLNYGLIA